MAVYYSPLMEELKVRNEELKEHVEQLKRELEYEQNQVKHAKEEKVREVKLAREQEQAKANEEKEDLKQKLQRQMQSELLGKIDVARKEWDIETASLRKSHKQELDSLVEKHNSEKKSLLEKLEVEKEKFKDDFLSNNKKEADKFIKEVFKLETQVGELHETIENLKQENKRIKDDQVKQKSEYNKESGDTDRQYRTRHQKQMEELKEKERIISEKEKQLSELRRKCTTIEMAKEKAEVDLQIAKRLGGIGSPPPSIGLSMDDSIEGSEGITSTEQPPRINKREEDLLITNSELGVLVKRMRNELQQLRKDKAVTETSLKLAENAVEPLKRRREEDVKRILNLTHTVDSKEKKLQQLMEEHKEMETERDKMKKELEAAKNASIYHKASDKRDGEVIKLRKSLNAKNKEIDELVLNNAKLNQENFKLKESADRQKKEKIETRKSIMASSAPHSPAVEKRVKDHRRLVELEQTLKDMSDKLAEAQRAKARSNQRMEDMGESLKRRDKRLKTLTDENHKLKSTNQLLEEARNRTHQEITDEWEKTQAELDRAHKQINKLRHDNNTLLEELGRRTPRPVSPATPSLVSPRHRSRSPSPRLPINESISPRQPSNAVSPQQRSEAISPQQLKSPNRTRSVSPRMRTPSPGHSLKPPSPGNQSSTPMKIPIATHYIHRTPSPQPPATPPDNHTPPHISPDRPLSPLVLSTSMSPPTHSSPQHAISIQIPQVETEPLTTSEQSLDPDFSSEISLESLKDKLELFEFEKEESKIWHDEQKEEFAKLKVKYKILKERYHSLYKRARSMSKKIQLAHEERLQMDHEIARLQSDRRAGIEFDVERETNLREKLNSTSDRVKKLEEDISKQLEENEQLQVSLTVGNEKREQMAEQLSELKVQLSQMESQLKDSETLMSKNEEVIDTKDKQMAQLERMLVDKEEELVRTNNTVKSLQEQEPWIQMKPQIMGCIESAQNTTNEIVKCWKSDEIQTSTDDDMDTDSPSAGNNVHKIGGLAHYVQQALEEAKKHIKTATNVPPGATPTEGFDDTDMPQSSNDHATPSHNQELEEALKRFEMENVEMKEKINLLQDELNETEGQLQNALTKLSEEGSSKTVQVETSSEEDSSLQNNDTSQLQEENESLRKQVKLQISQIADGVDKEDELQSIIKDLKEKLATSEPPSVQAVPTSEVKNEWFKEWKKKFDNEKKGLLNKIQDLEMRQSEATQRVQELQALIRYLEGQQGPGEETDSTYVNNEKDSHIAHLHQTISQLKSELGNNKSLSNNSVPSLPTSLGLEVNMSFQQTQQYVGRGDLNQARMGLQKLEHSISELLKAVYPQGILSPIPKNPVLTSRSPGYSLPSPHPLSVSLSPVTVSSSSEAELSQLNNISVSSSVGTPPVATLKVPHGKTFTRSGTRLFVTLLDYNPYSLCNTGHPERELNLYTGDVISVIGDMNSDGFYTGIFEGRTGLVPAKFLEEMDITDESAHKRLLNQNLSRSLSPSLQSLHGSEVDITSTPSTHRIIPITFESLVIPSEHSLTSQGPPRPSPPSNLTVRISPSGDGLIVSWKYPNIDKEGCSNGYRVSGYTVKCDSVIHKSVGETHPHTNQAYLEEVEPNEFHTISICTQSEDGVASVEVSVDYNPEDNQELNRKDVARSSQRSQDSTDSSIEKSKYMVATHDYTPSLDSPNPQSESDVQLSLTKGQVITVFGDIRHDGFYYGKTKEDELGLVPSSYVTDVPRPQLSSLQHVPMTINPSHIQTPPLIKKNFEHEQAFEVVEGEI